MENIKIVMCEHTGKEVLAQFFEGDVTEENDGWLHLHNEDEEDDKVDVDYFRENGKVLKRDFNGKVIN